MGSVLENVKCFLLDMDGTVHLSGIAIDGAAESVLRMRKRARVIFLTNNTSISRQDYAKKLCNMGIMAGEEDIYTAGNATIDYLNAEQKGKKVFLLGTKKLSDEFEREGITLTESRPDLVVIGFDTDLVYERLALACSFIREGVPYLLTHPDINCPTKNGYIPDVGSFDALIRQSTKRQPFIVCGKPHTAIADGVKKMTRLLGSQIAMIGDRLSTDMVFAKNNGFVSVLVLSGEATRQDLANSGMQVDLVLPSIAAWDAEL